MKKTFYTCIFDLDGTLANTLDSIAYFGNSTLSAFDLPIIPPVEYKLLVGNGADVLMERMLRRVGAELMPEQRALFRAEYDRRYEANPMMLVTTYPGLQELLGELKKHGILLAVLSNKPDNMTKHIAHELYPSLLREVWGQREGIPKKPDPSAVLKMAEALGVSPNEILYVGDSGVDMQTAKNAGMTSCGVLWGFREKKELLENGAEHIVSDAQELRALILGASK